MPPVAALMCFSIFPCFLSPYILFSKQVLDLGFIAFKPHIAAFLFSFLISFPTGFLLSKYIVWTDSIIRACSVIPLFSNCNDESFFNYFFIKLFVEYFHIYPTVAKLMTTVIVIIFSYLSQKHFTFK